MKIWPSPKNLMVIATLLGYVFTKEILDISHSYFLLCLRVLFEITQEDVLFLASPLTFDPSVVEIFVALSSVASLLIVPTSVKVLPSKLAAVLFSRHRVTILQVHFRANEIFSPSWFSILSVLENILHSCNFLQWINGNLVRLSKAIS